MGTPAFAVPSLDALTHAHDVIAVYTRPDSAAGRGSGLRPSAVKSLALELGIEVRQPETLRDPVVQQGLRDLCADMGVVAAYGFILPPEVLSATRGGFLNVHASLLPRWRGAAPIQRAILAGDERTGVSIMRMEAGLDTGPYCEVASTPMETKSAEALASELSELGAQALLAALRRIESGDCRWTPQEESAVTYAEKISKDDVRLAPDLPAQELLRRVRASSRQAPAHVHVGTSGLTVLAARAAGTAEIASETGGGSDSSVSAGAVLIAKGRVLLGAIDGAIELLRVKPDGRREMDAGDWARGANLSAGTRWSAAR